MRSSTGVVHLRVVTNGSKKNQEYLGFTLPKLVSEHVEHLKGREFACELTEDGILFRLNPEVVATAPAWAMEEDDDA